MKNSSVYSEKSQRAYADAALMKEKAKDYAYLAAYEYRSENPTQFIVLYSLILLCLSANLTALVFTHAIIDQETPYELVEWAEANPITAKAYNLKPATFDPLVRVLFIWFIVGGIVLSLSVYGMFRISTYRQWLTVLPFYVFSAGILTADAARDVIIYLLL